MNPPATASWAKIALTAIRGEMTMAEMIKKFEVQVPQITQWKKQLMSSAEAAFAKGDQLADDHEQEVLELRARIGQLSMEVDFFRTRARTDSRARRKEKVSPEEVLPITRQCELLNLASSYCRDSKRHLPSITDVAGHPIQIVYKVLDVVRVIAADIEQKHGAARVLTNLGEYQDSKHLHFHVIHGEPIESNSGML